MQNPSIKVSKNTLKMLKDWQKELQASTIEDTILLSLKWSQMLDGNLVPNITELTSRLISTESWVKSNAVHLIRFSNLVLKNAERMAQIESENHMLRKEIENLKKEIKNE